MLDGEIEKYLKGELAKSIKKFSRRFFETIDLLELRRSNLRDVYGGMFGAWHLLQNYDSSQARVKVFNPDYEKHGWQSPFTVIVVHCKQRSFVIDSLRMELNRRNITMHTIHNNFFTLQRDADGKLIRMADSRQQVSGDDWQREALIYIEISRHSASDKKDELAQTLQRIMAEVDTVVDDFEPMRDLARACIDKADQWFAPMTEEAREESKAFMQWLVENHFTFLGVDRVFLNPKEDSNNTHVVERTQFGLFKLQETHSDDEFMSLVQATIDKEDQWEQCISFDKSAVRSRVHRDAYPLYVRVKQFDGHGQLQGECRFLGLFSSSAYTDSTPQIPIMRKKVEAIIEASGLNPAEHDGRSLRRNLEVHPRDELFLSSVKELSTTLLAINAIQERRQVRLFMRTERNRKFVSCLLYTPRDIYRTELRLRIQQIITDELHATAVEFTTHFSESVLARTHFVFRVDEHACPNYDVELLELEAVEASKSWNDRLCEALVDEWGEELGNAESFKYTHAFPPGYQHDFDPLLAVNDIRQCNSLDKSNSLLLSFYRSLSEERKVMRLRLYHLAEPLPLSDIIPVLEHMGFRVLNETPYHVQLQDSHDIWIHDFRLIYSLSDRVDIAEIKDKAQHAFLRIWNGDAESDSFNKLLLGTDLDWREVALLRAYSRYMKQIQLSFSGDYIADTLTRNLPITEQLVQLFNTRFDPTAFKSDKKRRDHEDQCEANILASLDKVDNLNDDQLIRRYLELINATLRTNYFQCDSDGERKRYMSFKISPMDVSVMPLPKPMFEIFVYAPWVEGVHLRGGKVARGGLRWSDRLEDFRTEVLGLVKAQQVKNAVIVPVGAKGGFVAKRLPHDGGRDAIQAEGIHCYQTFIRGLLDITDNLIEGVVKPPEQVVRRDNDDSYLVVAADKGTATFSDIANALSAEYGFWLGDAFASGGSIGYDHKKMGITAKGAWVSVQRLFREKAVDVQKSDFTVVGIGDMSGDVFGNGMLLSPHICLQAAFNHLHIFIDPKPSAAKSFKERQRLFELPRSSWNDYDAELISKGGGVFKRRAKSIDITPQMKKAFAINEDRLTPSQLISALLCAPVDLLWNGGIGTYVKAHSETHADVGDKANDILRVDASKLRCKVVGEGGNLGLTQLARIEYALHGGAVNTDFIDNAAGVDCSDHEVNIKILLNEVVSAGDMTEKQRRLLLEAMTDNVSSLVLANNYRQTQAISIAESEVKKRMGEYRNLISALEKRGRLARALEYIPDDETLDERKAQGRGLTRPELSVLISYVKGELKEELVASGVPDDPAIVRALETAFPEILCQRFRTQVYQHRLRREIVATQVANEMVNLMGITFTERLLQSLGSDFASITRAFVTARDVFRLTDIWQDIEALDNQVPAQLQMEMMTDLMRLVRRATRWFVRNRRGSNEDEQQFELFQKAVDIIKLQLGDFLRGEARKQWQRKLKRLLAAGVPETLAHTIAGSLHLYASLGIAEAAGKSSSSVEDVASIYFSLGEKLQLDWINQQIGAMKIDNHWQALARESFLDDVEWQQSSLTCSVLPFIDSDNSEKQGIDQWLNCQAEMLNRWYSMITEIQQAKVQEPAMFSVAIRELLDLAQSSHHCNLKQQQAISVDEVETMSMHPSAMKAAAIDKGVPAGSS